MSKKDLGCGFHCLKSLIFLGNIILLALGVAAIGTGIYTKVEINRYNLQSSQGEVFNLAPVALIIVGFLIVLLSSVGLFGATKESRGYMAAYLFFTSILIILQFGAAVYGAAKFFNSNAKNTTFGVILAEQWSDSNIITDSDRVDIERAFNCCGWNNTAIDTSFTNGTSCTEALNTNATCEGKIETFITNNLIIITAILVGYIIIQIFWFVLSCCFCRAIRHEREENEHLLGGSKYVFK